MQVETLPAGTILHGRYRVERALGSGGFGHVYLSVDLQTRAQYAIKEYIVSGASGKAQLEHEVQVLRNLHHPNLPALLSAFDNGGRYYVVLGYIEGNDLTDYLRVARQKNEPIPLARLIEWLLSICDAVTFLHSQHPPIIHRDIKPDNIRITPGGTAILVDLGNAKTAADGARTLFFIRHQGTPGYAPLEQYPGGTGTDERSDVYALGGTLFFALTAHEPPSVTARNQSLQQKQPDLPGLPDLLAQNPPEGSQEARQFRLGISKPAKPQLRHSRHLAQLGTLPPELLRKLDSIIQRAMAMRPRDRYQSVADFSRDLKIVLRALPSSTLPSAPRRPVDPHSTQPDLPMLYEDLQKQKQADATPPTPTVPPPRLIAPRHRHRLCYAARAAIQNCSAPRRIAHNAAILSIHSRPLKGPRDRLSRDRARTAEARARIFPRKLPCSFLPLLSRHQLPNISQVPLVPRLEHTPSSPETIGRRGKRLPGLSLPRVQVRALPPPGPSLPAAPTRKHPPGPRKYMPQAYLQRSNLS